MDEVNGPGHLRVGAGVVCRVSCRALSSAASPASFFRQFAVTIAVSTVIFRLQTSLTLSPALAAILLKPHTAGRDPLGVGLLDLLLGWFPSGYSIGFLPPAFQVTAWARGAGLPARPARSSCLVYGGLLVLTGWIFPGGRPTGLSSRSRDQGRLICNIQLPDSASLERNQEAVAGIEAIRALRTPGVAPLRVAISRAFHSCCKPIAPALPSMFVILDPFEKAAEPRPDERPLSWPGCGRPGAREVKRTPRWAAFGAPAIPGASGVAGGLQAHG